MKDVILLFDFYDFRLDAESASRVAEAAPGFDVERGGDDTAPGVLERTVACYGAPTHEQLRRMPRLKWLHLPSAGADRYIDKALYQNDDVVVTKSSGVFGQPIAEYALGAMLMLSRNMHLYRDQQRARIWKGYIPETDFYGARVLILGMGDIGLNLASRAKALGAYVTCVKRTPAAKPAFVDSLLGMDALDAELPLADFVAMCLPGTPATRGVMDGRRLGMMKRSAVLVNVGRGPAIVHDDLVAALHDGVIKACALDVTDPEPLPADDPLWLLDNAFITPHNSGRSPTNGARAFDIFFANLNAFVEGKPMRNLVSFEHSY